MNMIRPVSDLRNNFADISKTVHETAQPVFLTPSILHMSDIFGMFALSISSSLISLIVSYSASYLLVR